MTVKFLVKNPKEGLNTIHIRVRNGKNVDLFLDTRQKTPLEDWNAQEGKLLVEYKTIRNGKTVTLSDALTKNKILENKRINDNLNELDKTVRKNYSDNPNQILNAEWLRNLLFPEAPKTSKDDMTFVEYVDIYLSEKGNTIKEATVSKVRTIKNNFLKFQTSKKKKKIKLREIDNILKKEFEKFFLEDLGNKQNTFNKTFAIMKSILFHAKKNGYEIAENIREIRFKYDKTVFTILTPEEIQLLVGKHFEEEHLETAKDWLLISCFTAARISDFMKFEISKMYQQDINGRMRWYIDYYQTKTEALVTIPVDSRIIEILNKRNWNFPRKMSETRYNQHIKEVCRLTGIDELTEGELLLDENGNENIPNKIKKSIKRKFKKTRGFYPKWKLVSSHIGRRSFASNNYGIIPTTHLMKFTGHTREQMLLNYIGKIETRITKELAQFIN